MFEINVSEELSRILWRDKAVKLGTFRLSSGKTSSIYIDMRTLLGYPKDFTWTITSLSVFAGILKEKLHIDCILGVATGGLAWSVPVALALSLPFAYHRGKRKEHGLSNIIEGCNVRDKKVLVIDDVATTGFSITNAYNDVIRMGGKVVAALVVIDRCQGARENLLKTGLTLYSLTDLHKIIETGMEMGVINRELAGDLIKEVQCES